MMLHPVLAQPLLQHCQNIWQTQCHVDVSKDVIRIVLVLRNTFPTTLDVAARAPWKSAVVSNIFTDPDSRESDSVDNDITTTCSLRYCLWEVERLYTGLNYKHEFGLSSSHMVYALGLIPKTKNRIIPNDMLKMQFTGLHGISCVVSHCT